MLQLRFYSNNLHLMIYCKILVYGIVQNVGFRYNLRSFAKLNGIFGFVRNLPDKSVEILFIGHKSLLKRFKEYLINNPAGSKVTRISIARVKKEEKFDSFEILY